MKCSNSREGIFYGCRLVRGGILFYKQFVKEPSFQIDNLRQSGYNKYAKLERTN